MAEGVVWRRMSIPRGRVVRAAPRSLTLRAQLTLAFLVVALVSVVAVAFWAHRITAMQLASYHERIQRGELMWMSEQPAYVRELWLHVAKPKWLTISQRKFLKGFDRSLWFGAATAGLLALLVGMAVSRRLAQPLRQLKTAAGGIAAGDLSQELELRGGGEFEEVAEAFNEMAGRLRESERLRRELLAAIAHELRTPLSIIQANLEAMLDGVTTPTPERITSLHTQSSLLTRLITDLRDLSLADAGQLALHKRPVDLAEICREAVEVVSPWIEERGVHVELQAEGSAVTDADPDRMRQVVQNLLHNAVRFTQTNGVVRMRVRPAEEHVLGREWVELTVEDEGPGIAPDDLPHIFEPFYRVDTSRSRASGGSGLGLTVVKHLVGAHGGDIRGENRPEGGARFTVLLPRSLTEPGALV